MAQAMHLAPERLEKLFQMSDVTLKKGLNLAEAEKYAHFFQKIGAEVEFVPPLPQAAPDFSNVPDVEGDLQATIVVAPRPRPAANTESQELTEPKRKEGLMGKIFGLFR